MDAPKIFEEHNVRHRNFIQARDDIKLRKTASKNQTSKFTEHYTSHKAMMVVTLTAFTVSGFTPLINFSK
jgi:hypothetical protein